MGFLETGFGVFALIIIWNIFLVGFGGIPNSAFISDQNFSGLERVGQVNVNLVDPVIPVIPYVTPTTNPEENKPFFPEAFGLVSQTQKLASKIIFGGADAIEQSAIPSPLNWVLSLIIKIFMTAYVGLFLYTLASGILGGSLVGI